MKTNHTARQIVQVRFVLSVLALVALLGLELALGGSMASRVGQTYSGRNSTQAVSPNVSISDFGALAR